MDITDMEAIEGTPPPPYSQKDETPVAVDTAVNAPAQFASTSFYTGVMTLCVTGMAVGGICLFVLILTHPD